jgi:hypothetical protein
MAISPGALSIIGRADLVAADDGWRLGRDLCPATEPGRTFSLYLKYYPGDIDIVIYPGKLTMQKFGVTR